MNLSRALPLVLAFTASAAWAGPPAGTFVFNMKNAKANGTITLSVSGANVRSEMDMNAQGMGPMKMTMLVKGADAKKGFLLNAAQKTYAEVDVGKRGAGASDKYTAKKLGNETVGKWKTTHVELTNDKGEKSEMWTTTEIDIGRNLFELLGARGPGDDGMMKALDAVGAKGFPVKMVASGREAVTLELMKYDAGAPAAALFEIPTDWTKRDAGGVMAGALPPEAQKKLEEAMKNMTPEQRAQMEKAMKAQAAQQH